MSASAVDVLLGMGMAIIFLGLAIYILLVVANWKIFEKAGEAGWKSIIPFYNTYISYKITWETKWFWINTALWAVGSIMSRMENGGVALVGELAVTAAAVIGIVQLYKLAKSFGHGVGYTIGLLLLPNVFTLILGFGGDVYQGPQK